MTDLIEFFYLDGIHLAAVDARDSKRVRATDATGRQHSVTPDRVLFAHRGGLQEAAARIARLQGEVDLELLWETLIAEHDLAAREADTLAASYFGESTSYHASAVFRAVLDERLHFRRRGKELAPRSPEEVERLRAQREAEAAAEAERRALHAALERREIDVELAQRIERHLRGQPDKVLQEALEQLFGAEAARRVHFMLVDLGFLPTTSDPELFAANLPAAHPAAVLAHVAELSPVKRATAEVAAFSIDDEETREVDDALGVTRDDGCWRVTIDIADVAAFVRPDDPVDREARRRGTTVYLPTHLVPMLPEPLGCELGSLRAGEERPVLRTTVWLEDDGALRRFALAATSIRVARRLDYGRADALLGAPTDEVGEQLATLHRLALARQQRRRLAGALFLSRQEWKVKVSQGGEEIAITPLDGESPSRLLVAEMMILANEVAAMLARDAGVPLIYRTQDPPLEPLPALDGGDPAAFFALKKLVKPAVLSLHARPHWGLGLPAYTQLTSPLRRYGDLILQRQIHAHLNGEPPPHTADELLTVLGTLEATEQQAKRLEAAVKQRWMLEHAARLPREEPLAAHVIGATKGGYKIRLRGCGAEGLLMESAALELGTELMVKLEQVRPRMGSLRARRA